MYAAEGARGVARLLGRQCLSEVCGLRGRGGGLDWLLDEKNVLFVLIAAFVLLVVADLLR